MLRWLSCITLLAVACAPAPDYSNCRLVGTWERRHVQPPPSLSSSEAERVRARGKDPDEILSLMKATYVPEITSGTEVFSQRGEWQSNGEVLGQTVETQSTWQLVEDRPDRITIQIPDPKAKDGVWLRRFDVVEADVFIERDSTGETKYVRVVPVR